ncbi:hypothetical protein FQA47_025101 [Oryzias melastigma]|uniref:Uncharacterized protein n=1 Tax=Oryzias melastigma TaxID=30732 RepID=A0A834BPS1_ORYME|nr:hypothetical protein FQA47_025101 [Oryzias melastigma]
MRGGAEGSWDPQPRFTPVPRRRFMASVDLKAAVGLCRSGLQERTSSVFKPVFGWLCSMMERGVAEQEEARVLAADATSRPIGHQPTAPGLKPSLHQAHEEEEENRREGKQSNDEGEEDQGLHSKRTRRQQIENRVKVQRTRHRLHPSRDGGPGQESADAGGGRDEAVFKKLKNPPSLLTPGLPQRECA